MSCSIRTRRTECAIIGAASHQELRQSWHKRPEYRNVICGQRDEVLVPAIVEAEKKFRRVHRWRDIANLVTALSELEAKEETTTERVA